MKTVIFQVSPARRDGAGTGSTVLTNALYGLIESLKDKPVNFKELLPGDPIINLDEISDDIIVIKTHNINIDELIDEYGTKCRLFFICSQRVQKNLLIDEKYKSYNNVIVFHFKDLNETETYTICDIITHIHDKIKNILNLELNIENAVNRIVSMNNFYEQIKSRPFKYHDDFYHIHGSHRNRDSHVNRELNTQKYTNPTVPKNNLVRQVQTVKNPNFYKNVNYMMNLQNRKIKMII